MSVKVDLIVKRQKGNKLKYVNNFFHLGFILYYLKKRNSEHNLCFLGEVKVYLAKNLGGSVMIHSQPRIPKKLINLRSKLGVTIISSVICAVLSRFKVYEYSNPQIARHICMKFRWVSFSLALYLASLKDQR